MSTKAALAKQSLSCVIGAVMALLTACGGEAPSPAKEGDSALPAPAEASAAQAIQASGVCSQPSCLVYSQPIYGCYPHGIAFTVPIGGVTVWGEGRDCEVTSYGNACAGYYYVRAGTYRWLPSSGCGAKGQQIVVR
jgi:hypothetical protein